jgi:hypothetical protein
MNVTERIKAVCSCRLQTDTVRILPFVVLLLPNQKNERVLQPDFQFRTARFAGKQCTQSRLVIYHCLTAPHSSKKSVKNATISPLAGIQPAALQIPSTIALVISSEVPKILV